MKNLMQFSPAEIKEKEFKKTVWGYSPVEVVDFLTQLAQLVSDQQKKEKQLIDEIRALHQELSIYKEKENEIALLKEKTKRECADQREKAIHEAELLMRETRNEIETIRGKTENWLNQLIEEAKQTELKRKQTLEGMKNFLDAHLKAVIEEEDKNTYDLLLENFLKDLRPRTLEGSA